MSFSSKHVQWAILLLLWAIIYLGTISTPAFFNDADSIHAEAAREMALSGDWVTLHINGIRYLEKAPLMYWLSALGIALLGQSDWAARFPLALFALCLTVLLYRFGSRFWGEKTGFYAALIYVTSLGPFAFTRILLPDVMLTFFLALAFYFYLQIVECPSPPRLLLGRWDGRALGIYAAAALAVLTKGLIGCVFVGAVIFAHLLLTGRWELLKRLHLVSGTLVFVLIAAPWHLVAGFSNKGFFWFYFINEHFLRYLGLRFPKDYDKVPLALFWLLHLAWVFPWTVFLWGVAHNFPRTLRPKSLTEQINVFPYLWIALILIFFSFSTSQEYYTFPTLPGFALLLGQVLAWLDSPQGAAAQRKARVSMTVLAGLGLVVGSGLLSLAWLGSKTGAAGDLSSTLTWNPSSYALSFGHFQDLTPTTFAHLFWLVVGTALLFMVGPALALVAVRRSRQGSNWRLAACCLAFMMAGLLHCYHAGMVAFDPILSSKALAAAIDKEYRPGDQIIINGRYEVGSSINYYTHKQVHILNGRIGNLWYGSYFADAPAIFYDDRSFLETWESAQRMFFFSEEPVLRAFLGRHPEFRYRVLAESGGKKILVNW
jgi:4-amino-4-deoxy-L-arabinose transferase-like glycosyltransferase